jgi:DNA-binding NarL/FixJ family response regulator
VAAEVERKPVARQRDWQRSAAIRFAAQTDRTYDSRQGDGRHLATLSVPPYVVDNAVTVDPKPNDTPSRQPRRAHRRTDKIQLLIVDEHALQRAGVRTLLENEEAVGTISEASTVDDAVDACRVSSPDVVLMDVDEATLESVDDMRRLRDQMGADAALVVLSRSEDDEGVYRAVIGGAAGHVGEDARPGELVDTIMSAAMGEEPISQTIAKRPAVARRVLEAYAELSARGPVVREPKLTERELSILGLAAEGMTNQQIGRSLGVSEHTIKGSISHILARLGLRHRTEAVVHAMRNGWITPASGHEITAAGNTGGRFVDLA